jgi:nucleoside-diphosphate-sugar epimerase
MENNIVERTSFAGPTNVGPAVRRVGSLHLPRVRTGGSPCPWRKSRAVDTRNTASPQVRETIGLRGDWRGDVAKRDMRACDSGVARSGRARTPLAGAVFEVANVGWHDRDGGTAMQTILGAGGPIGNELAAILSAQGTPFRLVSRTPAPVPVGEAMAADLTDPEATSRAIEGSTVVYLLVGLKYDTAVWREQWPRIMDNTIEACRRAGARLVFFDNVYMYGRVTGPMTEATPYAPCSKKGEVRARIATTLMNAVEAGHITALIARSADFYGPRAANSVPNMLVLDAMAKGARASWLVNASVPHSLTFTPDAARGVATLAASDAAWNQVWHVPTAPDPPTGEEFVRLAAQAFGVEQKYRVLSRPMLKVAGWFTPVVRESYELLYQSEFPYVFDSTKFARAFGFSGTPYAEGIRRAVEACRRG